MKSFRRFIAPAFVLLIALVLQYGVPAFVVYEDLVVFAGRTGDILFIMAIAWGLITAIRTTRDRLLAKADLTLADNLEIRKIHTQYSILVRIAVFTIILIAISVTLMTFEGVRSIGISLFASAGVAGLIIGLAAQKALGTILAGLQIAITQPIRIDDVVIVENEWGWIEEIHLTYVVVRIWDLRRLIVPSTYFLDQPFQNWTRTSADILGTVFIYTDYTMPVAALRDELTRLLEANPMWDRKVNVLQVTDAREYTLEIRALMSASSSPRAWDLRVHVREKLIEFIQREYPACLPKTRVDVSPSLRQEQASAPPNSRAG
jgi:small-conductance mechanosensitive channel